MSISPDNISSAFETLRLQVEAHDRNLVGRKHAEMIRETERADHLRDLLVRSTVTIVRTMMETKTLPETRYDADPVQAAIRTVYKTLSEVSA